MSVYVSSLLVCALSLLSGCRGLELSMNRDPASVPKYPATCGVLRCEKSTLPSKSEKGPVDRATSFSSINSMTIFKKVSAVLQSNEPDHQEVLIAAISTKSPGKPRMEEGLSGKGVLNAQGAILSLNLAKQSDCIAQFVCKVQGVDANGKDLTSTITLQPQSQPSVNQKDGGTLGPAISLQLLTLVQQLDTKLALVSRSVDGWERSVAALEKSVLENMASVERRLEDKIDELHNDLQAEMESLQTKRTSHVVRLGDKLDSFGTRIEDKLSDKVVDKLHQLDIKVSTFASAGALCGKEVSSNTNTSLETLVKDLHSHHKHTLEDVCHDFNTIKSGLANVTAVLSLMETRISQSAVCPQLSLTEMTGWDEFTGLLINQTLLSQQMLMNIFGELELAMQNNTDEAMSFLREFSSVTQHPDMTELLGSMLKDAFSPKRCKRGMVTVPNESPYPYLLISPNPESGLNVPYLCDTVTDGGGWIVIQRRATGNTNFNRNWADYKEGFGLLDSDFWLGNDKIHTLTSKGIWELRVDITFQNEKAYAQYTGFSVTDEMDKYRLQFKSYNKTSSTLFDDLSYHNNNQFSTYDNDNDNNNGNCARMHIGGWWYNSCDMANLNSQWGAGNDQGLEWTDFTGPESAEFSEMKIRLVE